MKADFARDQRIISLFYRAVRKKYTEEGVFSESKLYNDALEMGVTSTTAQSYTNAVIIKLVAKRYLKR